MEKLPAQENEQKLGVFLPVNLELILLDEI